MKKYRLTKITVTTKEIISAAKDRQDDICPHCHRPLSVLPFALDGSAAAPHPEKPAAELLPAKVKENQ